MHAGARCRGRRAHPRPWRGVAPGVRARRRSGRHGRGSDSVSARMGWADRRAAGRHSLAWPDGRPGSGPQRFGFVAFDHRHRDLGRSRLPHRRHARRHGLCVETLARARHCGNRRAGIPPGPFGAVAPALSRAAGVALAPHSFNPSLEIGDDTQRVVNEPPVHRVRGSIPRAPDQRSSVSPEPPVSRQLTVLLVASDGLTRQITANGLAMYGYEALVARTGEEALGLLESARRVDVVVVDADLGGEVTGLQVATTARAANPRVDVIY